MKNTYKAHTSSAIFSSAVTARIVLAAICVLCAAALAVCASCKGGYEESWHAGDISGEELTEGSSSASKLVFSGEAGYVGEGGLPLLGNIEDTLSVVRDSKCVLSTVKAVKGIMQIGDNDHSVASTDLQGSEQDSSKAVDDASLGGTASDQQEISNYSQVEANAGSAAQSYSYSGNTEQTERQKVWVPNVVTIEDVPAYDEYVYEKVYYNYCSACGFKCEDGEEMGHHLEFEHWLKDEYASTGVAPEIVSETVVHHEAEKHEEDWGHWEYV